MEMNSDERNFDNEEWVTINSRSADGREVQSQDRDSSFRSVVQLGGQANDSISEEEMQRLTSKHEEESAVIRAKLQKIVSEKDDVSQALVSTEQA